MLLYGLDSTVVLTDCNVGHLCSPGRKGAGHMKLSLETHAVFSFEMYRVPSLTVLELALST